MSVHRTYGEVTVVPPVTTVSSLSIGQSPLHSPESPPNSHSARISLLSLIDVISHSTGPLAFLNFFIRKIINKQKARKKKHEACKRQGFF